MSDDKKQVEVIELQTKMTTIINDFNDTIQKMDIFKGRVDNSKKSVAESGETMATFTGELRKAVGVFGVELPGAIGLTTIAMAAIGIDQQVLQARDWQKTMMATTTVTEEWTRSHRDDIVKLADAYGLLTSDVEEFLVKLGQQRIPQEQIIASAKAGYEAVSELHINGDQAAKLVGYAVERQGKSPEQFEREMAQNSLLAQQMGVPNQEWASALVSLQGQQPETSLKVKPESMMAFIKEFHELGPTMLGSITGASEQQRFKWEGLYGVSEQDIESAPEKILSKMMDFTARASQGKDAAGRKVIIQSLVQSLAGLSGEASVAIINQLDQEMQGGTPFDKVVAAMDKQNQEALEKTPGYIPEIGSKAEERGRDWVNRIRMLIGDRGLYGIGSFVGDTYQPLNQNDKAMAQGLLSQLTPEQQAKWLESTFNPNQFAKLPIGQQMPTSLRSLQELQRIANPQTNQQILDSLFPAQQSGSSVASSTTPTRIQLDIHLTGPGADQVRDVQQIGVIQEPTQNIGLNLIRRGQSIFSSGK